MKTVLVIDMGSQSMRGIIIDEKGNLLAKEQIKYPPYVTKEKGYVEQDVEVFWQSLCQVTQSLKQNHAELLDGVLAMSVDTFRDTSVLLDKNNKPVRDCIMWQDLRCADTKQEKLPLKLRLALRLVGMTATIDAIRQKVKTRWVKQCESEVWQKVEKVTPISGYINYKLTGQLVDAYSATIGHLPFDFKKRRWYNKKDLLYPVYSLEREKMIPIVAPGDCLGTISHKASIESGLKEGLKVIASGSDKGCETLGVGCIEKNCASVSFGTAASIQFSTKDYFEPEPMMPSYPAVLKDYYNPEVQIFYGYWMIGWFKNNFAKDVVEQAEKQGCLPEKLLNKWLASVPVGCDGLVLQPFWQGGLTNPEARGSIIGFTEYHTREHLYRAIIEGIDFALREGMERMERRGKQKIEYVAVSGGGSQSDEICQIAADVFGKPVRRVQTFETSALGSAIATFSALGVYSSPVEAVKEMVHYKDEFLPNPENAKAYDKIFYNVYMKMYPSLRKIFTYQLRNK